MLLYLDTHPCDEAALSYFMEHKNRRVAALKEYAKYYYDYDNIVERMHYIINMDEEK